MFTTVSLALVASWSALMICLGLSLGRLWQSRVSEPALRPWSGGERARIVGHRLDYERHRARAMDLRMAALSKLDALERDALAPRWSMRPVDALGVVEAGVAANRRLLRELRLDKPDGRR